MRLRPDSYCIDSGAFTNLLTEDLDGVPRPYNAVTAPRGDESDFDMGAYEFVGFGRENQLPEQPTNLSPPHGATDELPILTLVSSPFMDPDGDLHSGTRFQISGEPTFATPTDSGPIPFATTQIVVPPHALLLATTYWWRASYLDHLNDWSPWSTPTRFTTKAVDGMIVPEQYPTIQAAIDAAPPNGGKIVVAPGTYFENLATRAKNFTLTSIDPDDDLVVSQTIIDGRGATHCLVFNGNEDDRTLITGLTFTNSGGTPYAGIHGNLARGGRITKNRIVDNLGAGIRLFHGTVQDNLIERNRRSGLWQCHGMIEGNLIRANSNRFGGGLKECNGYIRRNFIRGNSAIFVTNFGDFVGVGGGLYECGGFIENNLIFGNVAADGGSGLFGCDGPIRFNTIVNNQTVDGVRTSQLLGCNGQINSCIIVSQWDSSLVQSSVPFYSCISEWTEDGNGNISADPVFVDRDNRDFHLSAESPCIDAGREVQDATLDLELNPRGIDSINVPRGDGSNYDIGAFEYGGPFILASDLNESETVDELDLFEFSSGWALIPLDLDPRDFDLNQEIDALDLHVLLHDWKMETGAR